jgi:hypothetical protein
MGDQNPYRKRNKYKPQNLNITSKKLESNEIRQLQEML